MAAMTGTAPATTRVVTVPPPTDPTRLPPHPETVPEPETPTQPYIEPPPEPVPAVPEPEPA